MPNCRTCNPVCQRCHNKPGFTLPQECPVCGRFNPAHWETCPKCNTPIKVPPQSNEASYLSAETKKLCFQCEPLVKPRCGDCIKEGRIKVCPECKSFVLGTREDCKQCGHLFESPTV